MNIKVFSFSVLEVLGILLPVSFLTLLCVCVLILGIRDFNLILTLIGLILCFFLIYRFLITEKNILFSEEFVCIETISFKLEINYSDIEKIQFQRISKAPNFILVRLKTRHRGRKNFQISLDNDRKNIRDLMNHARSKGVPTGLNVIGEPFLIFDPKTGKYSVKEVFSYKSPGWKN